MSPNFPKFPSRQILIPGFWNKTVVKSLMSTVWIQDTGHLSGIKICSSKNTTANHFTDLLLLISTVWPYGVNDFCHYLQKVNNADWFLSVQDEHTMIVQHNVQLKLFLQ